MGVAISIKAFSLEDTPQLRGSSLLNKRKPALIAPVLFGTSFSCTLNSGKCGEVCAF